MKGTEAVVERTVTGLGYELVEAQLALGGRHLQVGVDLPLELLQLGEPLTGGIGTPRLLL